MPTLAELEAEIKELQERLRVTAGLAEAMRAYEATIGVKVRGGNSVTIRHRSAPSHRPASAMGETEKAARDLMVRTGGPVSTVDVVKEMVRQGMAIPPGKTVNVVSARLSNNPRFKARRGLGYWLVGRAWPGEEVQEPLGFNENGAPTANTEDAPETALAAQ